MVSALHKHWYIMNLSSQKLPFKIGDNPTLYTVILRSYDLFMFNNVCGISSYLYLAFVATFKDLKKNKTQLTTIIPPIIHQVLYMSLLVSICFFVYQLSIWVPVSLADYVGKEWIGSSILAMFPTSRIHFLSNNLLNLWGYVYTLWWPCKVLILGVLFIGCVEFHHELSRGVQWPHQSGAMSSGQ